MSSIMTKTLDKMTKDLFCDFLTIAIHGLLHNRKAYPAGVFKLRQKFNMPVQVCYHPDVFNYITELIKEVGDVLSAKALHAVHVLIYTSANDSNPEQFTFRLHSLNDVITQDQLLSLERELRVCLLKLAIVDSYLPSSSSSTFTFPDVTWRVELDAADRQLGEGTTWHRVGNSLPVSNQANNSLEKKRKIVSLKTVSTESIKLELFAKI